MAETLIDLIDVVFGGDAPHRPLQLHQAAARSLLLLFVGVVLIRIGKSRLLGRATPVDALMGFTLGSVLSRGMTGTASLSETFAGSAALVFGHWLLTAATARWHALGNLVKGHSEELVIDGVMLQEKMRQSNVSVDDLLEQLRLNGNVDRIEDVKLARKERSGEISVVKKAERGLNR